MELVYNEQILKVRQSEIREFNDYAKSVGANIILTLGEPDFDTPEMITKEAILALEKHQTKYGPTLGFQSLREKIAQFETTKHNYPTTVDEVIITHGSTEGLTTALFTILNPDDEVIIPTPAYPMYRQIVEFCKAKVVTIDTTSSNFQITKKALQNAITDKTKAIILTSPNNPTGSIYSDETYEIIHELLYNKPIFVICDEVYNQINYTSSTIGFTRYQDMKDRIIICQSYSKSYAMPGWRCGYLIASKDFCKQAMKIHQYMIVALNTFIQPAMEKALEFDSKEMVKSYQTRRDYVYNRLTQMGLDVMLPDGAFYIFPSIEKYHLSSMEFCKMFAEKYKVAIIPGCCFEADQYIRISYCVDFE
ncbi:MAG: aminotransferase class I/II-fold pyridoxal phosphate-dependent enzyme, partial [Anaeroplasmataceae bacterium]|nr:aminotransferase class I/II-fold pyridoxal phosphate-dependent enzyme [Anaeroplasmataceae bacterium]